MLRILRLCSLFLFVPFLATGAGATDHYVNGPIYEVTSTGLLTFGRADARLRVAVIFAEDDDAVVEAVVRIVDGRGEVLHRHRGTLQSGAPVVADLTRRQLGHGDEVLLRVEVALKLPGIRNIAYPIVVTAQPIARDGIGSYALNWRGGTCACPAGYECGPLFGPGQHADCAPPDGIVSEF